MEEREKGRGKESNGGVTRKSMAKKLNVLCVKFHKAGTLLRVGAECLNFDPFHFF